MTEVIAHRGASAYAPDNAIEAFDLALEQAADALEFDLRQSVDGELVLVHDPTPLTAAELGAPVLDDVLARYGRSTRYLIDLKEPAPGWETRVAHAVDSHGLRDRVIVQSFDGDALVRLRSAFPWLALAALCRERDEPARHLDLAAELGSGLGAWHPSIDHTLAAAARERGVPLRAWTVDEPAEIRRVLDLGVAAIITNVPDVSRSLIVGAGPGR